MQVFSVLYFKVEITNISGYATAQMGYGGMSGGYGGMSSGSYGNNMVSNYGGMSGGYGSGSSYGSSGTYKPGPVRPYFMGIFPGFYGGSPFANGPYLFIKDDGKPYSKPARG